MARQPSGTGSAEGSPDAHLEELRVDGSDEIDSVDDDDAVDDPQDDDEDEPAATRSAESDALWTDVRIQPVEIALPSGVGYTLRAYRLSTEVRDPEIGDRDDDFPATRHNPLRDDDDLDEREVLGGIDEDELTAQALAAGEEGELADDEADEGEHDVDAETGRHRADTDTEGKTEDEADAEEEGAADDSDEDAETPEDVPVFLSEGGKLLLFATPEGLVEYVRGDAEHEMTQLDTWAELRERIEPEDIVPLHEDTYELDLVVENLRGGHDVWEAPLIIQAGEIARDVAYALRLQAVMTALAPGSPLDDMDEGLRTVEEGGFGAFFARRKLRKIDAQTTAALGWRTIIGKISAIVDWRN